MLGPQKNGFQFIPEFDLLLSCKPLMKYYDANQCLAKYFGIKGRCTEKFPPRKLLPTPNVAGVEKFPHF